MRKLFAILLCATGVVLWVGSVSATDDCVFIRGDANHDHDVDMSDATCIANWYSYSSCSIYNLDAGDANDDGQVDLSDVVYLTAYLSLGTGPEPPYPYDDPSTQGLDDCVEGDDDALEFDECGTNYVQGTCSLWTETATTFSADSSSFDSFGEDSNETAWGTKTQTCNQYTGMDAVATYRYEIEFEEDPVKMGELKGLKAVGNDEWSVIAAFNHKFKLFYSDFCDVCNGDFYGKIDNTAKIYGSNWQVWVYFTVDDGEDTNSYSVLSEQGAGHFSTSDPNQKFNGVVEKRYNPDEEEEPPCDCIEDEICIHDGYGAGGVAAMDCANWRSYWGLTNTCPECTSETHKYTCEDELDPLLYSSIAYESVIHTWTAEDLYDACGGDDWDMDADVFITGFEICNMTMELDAYQYHWSIGVYDFNLWGTMAIGHEIKNAGCGINSEPCW